MAMSTRQVVETAIDTPSRRIVEGSIDLAKDSEAQWSEMDLNCPTWVKLAGSLLEDRDSNWPRDNKFDRNRTFLRILRD